MSKFIIKAFIWFFKVDFSEAEKDWSEYPNLREFFIRKLRPGLRPIAQSPAVHPSDSRVQEHGAIELDSASQDLKLIQAKGFHYSIKELSQDQQAFEKWNKGYFITYYLHPRDYHWVHSPVDGKIKEIKKIPGHLWPVNQMAVHSIPNLYIKNARIFIELETEWGSLGVCLVGAFNVGRISLVIEKEQKVSKGDPLGYFNFGSTVVVIYPQKFTEIFRNAMIFETPIRVGRSLIKA